MHPQPRILTLTAAACLALATASAQTPPAVAPAATPSAPAAAAPAISPPASTSPAPAVTRPAPATPVISDKPPAPWARPANGPALFTEDFESGAIDPKIWTLRSTNGPATATIVQDKVAHGKNALKLHYPANTGRAYAFLSAVLPAAVHDHLYGRAYVYITGLPQPHSVLMLAGSAGWPAANWLEIGAYHDAFQPSIQHQAPGAPRGETPAFEGPIPYNRWFCLEWEFIENPNRIVEWVDGKLAVNQTFALNGVDTGLTGGFVEFNLGFRTFAQAATITQDLDIYYDDIAISDKPIGQLAPVPAPAGTPAPATK